MRDWPNCIITMLEIKNHTPLSVSLIPGLDQKGTDYAVVVIKGKFKIITQKKIIELADEPAEIIETDEYYGEPGLTSIKYASDLSLLKKTTDVVLNGHAYTPNEHPAQWTNVKIGFDHQQYELHVFGNRYWEKSAVGWDKTEPVAFEKMALCYENAFGGSIFDKEQGELKAYYPQNPVGKGFIDPSNKRPTQGQPLPNIENAQSLIDSWKDMPSPAGVGFISPNWSPRAKLAGTFDDDWTQNQMPLLPHDFNPLFFNAAHPSLIASKFFTGEETFTLKNVTRSGLLCFQLPSWEMPVTASIKGKTTDYQPNLDTILIEPDDNNVYLTWRVSIPCPRNFLHVDYVRIGQRRTS